MPTKKKVSVTVQQDLLEEIDRSAGALSRSAVFEQALAAWVPADGAGPGIFAAPEGGAVAAAVPALIAMDALGREDEVVLFNTGSGLKYVGMSPIS